MFSSNTSQQSEGYQIQRSLRFNSADSAYLSRTYANSSTDLKRQTFSFWMKRTEFTTAGIVFGGYDGSSGSSNYIGFLTSTGTTVLRMFFAGGDIYTTQVFRDPSAWYHIVVALDTTQATDTNRLKLYVNGSQVTLFTVNAWPTLNGTSQFSLTNSNNKVGSAWTGSSEFYNGYMTEVNFIDGQALTPSSFGQTNANTGVWEPKPYAGTYGTNGFYLNFSDNSNTTATTLGKDYSGNGNNWTPNNFSVSAGAGNDSLVDVPTAWGTDTGVGGTVRGNYCTLSPITVSGQGIGTLANGNLDVSGTSTSWTGCVSTIAASTGKWYFEATPTVDGTRVAAGIINVDSLSGAVGNQYGLAQVADAWFRSNTVVQGNASNLVTGLTQITNNDVLMVAVDFDAGKIWFGRNGTWDSSGNPATGANATITFTPGGKTFYAAVQGYSNTGAWSAVSNFGQRPFAYSAPSGFKALCTQNLPTPTVGATASTQAGKYFNPVLYTGTGTTQNITGVGFQPDLVWTKARSNAFDNVLVDVLRGASRGLFSNLTIAEDFAATGYVTGFLSDGFSVNTGTGSNNNGATYVAWNWKANGAGVTNTAGSITSTVSANTTSGFSVVTYSGNSTLGATVGHGLGTAPKMIIVKSRSGATNWPVYHASIGNTKAIFLNLTNATDTDNYWNNTSPTSTVFSLNASSGLNSTGSNYVAYCFAEVPGFSKFGSYTGNGSTDGPFVYCGFRPAFLMVKRADSTGNWTLLDATRNPSNAATAVLYPNLADAEATSATGWLFLSNGVKSISTGADWNAGAGTTYIFAAFAQNPFKYSLAR